jgi:hypothetical protein
MVPQVALESKQAFLEANCSQDYRRDDSENSNAKGHRGWTAEHTEQK